MPTIERDGSSVIMFTAFVAVGFGNGVANHVVSCELCLPVQIMEREFSIIFVVDGNGGRQIVPFVLMER